MATSRGVTNEDLAIIDKAIANHEECQRELYTFRMVLSQVGKVDAKRGDLIRGVEAEQARFDEVHQRADAAQADLDELHRQIEGKQRELAAVEETIKERELRSTQLSDGINGLRNMLAAA
jgi:peptidoglycan hydrolase CwlO-like protein